MANVRNTTLYTGVTSDLYARVFEHKEGKYPKSFTARYNITKLVYYESFRSIEEAIDREKQIKGGSRADKEKLINSLNPEWKDLFEVVKNGNIHHRRACPTIGGRRRDEAIPNPKVEMFLEPLINWYIRTLANLLIT